MAVQSPRDREFPDSLPMGRERRVRGGGSFSLEGQASLRPAFPGAPILRQLAGGPFILGVAQHGKFPGVGIGVADDGGMMVA